MHYKDNTGANDNSTNQLIIKMRMIGMKLTSTLTKDVTHIIINDMLRPQQKTKLHEIAKQNGIVIIGIAELMQYINE